MKNKVNTCLLEEIIFQKIKAKDVSSLNSSIKKAVYLKGIKDFDCDFEILNNGDKNYFFEKKHMFLLWKEEALNVSFLVEHKKQFVIEVFEKLKTIFPKIKIFDDYTFSKSGIIFGDEAFKCFNQKYMVMLDFKKGE